MSDRVCSIRTVPTLLAATLWVVPGARAEEGEPIRILLLGDSTTEGSIPRCLQPEGPHLEQVVRLLLQAGPNMPKLKIYNSGNAPLRPRALGGKGAEGMKKGIPSNRTPTDPGPSEGREPRG